ncbi:hypothetical protein [Amycolatopsis sp. NPDC051102]
MVESVEELIRHGLPKLSLTRALPQWALIALLVVWLASFGSLDSKH